MSRSYRVSPDATISNIDLDAEEFILEDGTRLTEELAAELAAREERRLRNLVPGRKSLSGGTIHSPVIQVRVPATVRERIETIAATRGVSVSKVTRDLIEESLDRLAS